jgi:hypothetical protein
VKRFHLRIRFNDAIPYGIDDYLCGQSFLPAAWSSRRVIRTCSHNRMDAWAVQDRWTSCKADHLTLGVRTCVTPCLSIA